MANNNPNYTVTIQQAADTTQPNPQSVTIQAPMPDSFSFDTRAEYSAPFAQGLFGNGTMASLARLAGLRLTVQALTAQLWQGSTETELGLELEFHAESDPDMEVRTPILQLMKMATASTDPTTQMLKAPGPQLNLDLLKTALPAAVGSTLSGIVAGVAGAPSSSNVSPQSATMTSAGSTTNGQNSTNAQPAASNGLGSGQWWKSVVTNSISIRIGNYAYFDCVVITNVQKTYGHQIDYATGLPMYAKVAINFKPLFLLLQSDLDQIFAVNNGSNTQSSTNPAMGISNVPGYGRGGV